MGTGRVSSSGDSCSWAINKVSVRGGFRRGKRKKTTTTPPDSFYVNAADPSVSVISFSCFFPLVGDLWRDNYKSVGSCSRAAAVLCWGVAFRSCFEIYPSAICLSSSILIPPHLPTHLTCPPDLPRLPSCPSPSPSLSARH